MKRTKWLAGFLIGPLLLAGILYTPVAAKEKEVKAAQPISIEADELYFSDKTGEMFAQGNVIIMQEQNKIFADIIRGNDKETEVWVDGPVRFQDPQNQLAGMRLRYNYGSKFGMMQEIEGQCSGVFVKGQKAEFNEGKYTLYSTSATGCKTKGTPDYRVTARKVEIWPGDKMIAYDAKVWIKNTVIYSTPRLKRSLKKGDDEDNQYPRIGYQDQDGFYISQRLGYAFSDNVSAYTDLTFYTKVGFRPTFGVIDQEKAYTMSLITGQFRDDNNNWIQKEPEFRFDLNPRRIGKLPLQYKAGLILGQWKDDTKSSWHQDLHLDVTGDPLYFDKEKTWMLNTGAGIGQIRESFDSSQHTNIRYNLKLTKKISPALTAWTAYNYNGDNASIFAYNKPEVAKEGILGLSWKVNNRTTLSYYTSYDFANKRTYEDYYTIRQSFHCWETEVTYRAVKKELAWTFRVAQW